MDYSRDLHLSRTLEMISSSVHLVDDGRIPLQYIDNIRVKFTVDNADMILIEKMNT